MRREPEERYADLGEMGEALRGWLEHGVSEARDALRSSRILRVSSALTGCFWWLLVAVGALLLLVAFVPLESVATRTELDLALTPAGAGVLLLVRAEVFRVGAELESERER